MSAVEILERVERAKFDETAFVEFLESMEGRSGWGDGGRWELIGGIPIDMPPATVIHTTIAENLERLLRGVSRLIEIGLDVRREAGVRHPQDEFFRPVADLIVYDSCELKGRDKDRFFGTCQLICEVLSPSTRHHDLIFKRRLYMEMPDCLHILFIEQDTILARHWSRERDWSETVYDNPRDRIDLPEFGFSCQLRDLYARTDLASEGKP